MFVWISVGMEVAFGNWIFTYTLKQLGMGERQGHLLNAAYWGAFTAGRVIASGAALVVSPLTVLLVSMPLAMVGSGIAVVLPAQILAGQGGWVMAGVAILVGLGVSTAFANALAILDDAAPISGTVTGVLGGLAGAGCMVFPLLIALVAKYTALGYQGLMWSMLLAFVALFVCLAGGLRAGQRVKQMREQQLKSGPSLHFNMDGSGPLGAEHRQQQQEGALEGVPLLQAVYPVG
jgi:fucose permease